MTLTLSVCEKYTVMTFMMVRLSRALVSPATPLARLNAPINGMPHLHGIPKRRCWRKEGDLSSESSQRGWYLGDTSKLRQKRHYDAKGGGG